MSAPASTTSHRRYGASQRALAMFHFWAPAVLKQRVLEIVARRTGRGERGVSLASVMTELLERKLDELEDALPPATAAPVVAPTPAAETTPVILSKPQIQWIEQQGQRLMGLRPRQLAVLLFALRQAEFSFAELADHVGLTRQGAQECIRRLAKQELLAVSKTASWVSRAPRGYALRPTRLPTGPP